MGENVQENEPIKKTEPTTTDTKSSFWKIIGNTLVYKTLYTVNALMKYVHIQYAMTGERSLNVGVSET
jgi:hypothetical protein